MGSGCNHFPNITGSDPVVAVITTRQSDRLLRAGGGLYLGLQPRSHVQAKLLPSCFVTAEHFRCGTLEDLCNGFELGARLPASANHTHAGSIFSG